LEAWSAAQAGLLRAAWHISRNNPHVKVYATIRQEAYASFGGTERNNIKGSILLLRYSKEDLNALFNKAILHYEGLSSVEEFAGLQRVYNEYVKQSESVFDYIHRHLIDVPRWFTILGGKLSELKKGEIKSKKECEARLETFRSVVNNTSAELAKDYLCSEMKLFFRDLDPNEMTRELFSRVHSTVLSYTNVDYLAHLLRDQYGWKHPFSLLYNLGLLGLVQPKPGSTMRYQVFKKPYEFDWGFNNILPEDKKMPYLLHPALHFLITKLNPGCRFSGVLLGDGVPLTPKNDAAIRRETIKLFVSYAHVDEGVVKDVVRIMQNRLDQEIRPYEIWQDTESMQAGRQVYDQIMKGLEESDFLILMASPNSLKSKFVKLEWQNKFFSPFYNKTKSHDNVIPIFLLGTTGESMPDFLKSIYGFSYNGVQDSSNIERLVEQMLDRHPRLK
jgi:TIR domain